MRILEHSHKEHVLQRNSVLEQHQRDLTDNLALNKDLAARYRQLQNEYVVLKNEVLNKYDDRVKLENTIKDLKQVCSSDVCKCITSKWTILDTDLFCHWLSA